MDESSRDELKKVAQINSVAAGITAHKIEIGRMAIRSIWFVGVAIVGVTLWVAHNNEVLANLRKDVDANAANITEMKPKVDKMWWQREEQRQKDSRP